MDDSTKVNRLQSSDDENEYENGHNGRKENSIESLSSISSTSSTPNVAEQIVPKYKVRIVTNSVQKNGESVYYNLITKIIDETNADGDQGKNELQVCRQYDDFVYLHHCLVTALLPGHGLIIPPLPEQPALNANDAQTKSKHKLGSATRTIISDEWYKDCWNLQEYLRLMLTHRLFAMNPIWKPFLLEQDAPVRVKVRRSFNLIERLTDTFDKARSTHKDCDEFFQHERDQCQTYLGALKVISDHFNSIIHARLKLCGVLAHLSTALNINLDDSESSISRFSTKFSNQFSLALDDYRDALQVINHNDEASLGALLELWTRYIDAEREMLLKRTCLLIDYENANRQYDKSKPNKRDLALQQKLEAEKVFEECSEVARQEIKSFHKHRISALSNGIRRYCEAQLLVNHDIYVLMEKSLGSLRKFQI